VKIVRRLKMGRTIKARFSKGIIKPLEKIDLREGEEITIDIRETPSELKKKNFLEALKTTAGGWRDLVDCDELKKKNIYNDRLISTRPEVKL
jgi:predicted DNA-binding antitoxin AbrB/MazE fold protein